MKLKRCEYGHYYDPSKYSSCPHCEVRDKQETTMALYDEAPQENAAWEQQAQQAGGYAPGQEDDPPTMASYAKDSAVTQPPVGYLICLRGAARGQDFRLHAQRNTIGRSSAMDVCIKGDLGISRETNAVLSYNPRARSFHLIPGEGKSIVYVSGQEVMTPVQLKGGEIIEIGDTSLVFLPVCGPGFDWEDEGEA